MLESRAHQGYANISSSQLPIQQPLLMNQNHHRKRKLLDEETQTILPHPPATGIASGEASSANLNFQQYVVSKQIKLNLGKDPRQELFAYHNANNKNTKSFGLENEPKILATKTAEQEEDELKRQQL